ncbi:MAG: CBS domain-containing protein [Salinivenus sp.]
MKYTSAKDLMTSDVKVVEADWPLDRVAGFLVEHDISGAPVVEEDNTLVGVISLTDLARHDSVSGDRTSSERPAAYYRNELEHLYAEEEVDQLRVWEGNEATAREAMTDEIYDVSEHTSIQQVAQVMYRGRIHRVFVTANGDIQGVITARDMLRVIAES